MDSDKLKSSTDADLAAQVLAGKKDAYSGIVERYQDRLRSVLSFFCHSQQEIEEIAQDAFVQGFVRLEQHDAAAPIFPWLKAIALNLLRMQIRQAQREKRKGADYLRHLQMARVQDDRDGIDAEARSEALEHCMGDLPKGQAGFVRAKYEEGISMARLAGKYNIQPATLKVRLHRIRQLLKKCVQKRLAMAG